MVHLTRGTGQRHDGDGSWLEWWRGRNRCVLAAPTHGDQAQGCPRQFTQTNTNCYRCCWQEGHHIAGIEQGYFAIECVILLGPD